MSVLLKIVVILLSALCTQAEEKFGDATFYNIEVGLTACGSSHKNADFIAATAFGLWTTPNPNVDPMCQKTATVTNPSNGKSVTVQIKDKCFACKPNDIDLTEKAFKELGVDLAVGRFKVNWHLNN